LKDADEAINPVLVDDESREWEAGKLLDLLDEQRTPALIISGAAGVDKFEECLFSSNLQSGFFLVIVEPSPSQNRSTLQNER
jgi:hypothetical protein